VVAQSPEFKSQSHQKKKKKEKRRRRKEKNLNAKKRKIQRLEGFLSPCSAGAGTQGLMYAREALSLSYTPTETG
jgi:hypothetical protein